MKLGIPSKEEYNPFEEKLFDTSYGTKPFHESENLSCMGN